MDRSQKHKDFWEWFEGKSDAFLTQPALALIDEILAELGKVDDGISAELSSYNLDTDRVLIVTSHGDQSRFQTISDLVSEAPLIEGWCFQALKPPRGFSFSVGGRPSYSFDDWTFVPLRSSANFEQMGLRIEVPAPDFEHVDNEVVLEILEEGVGEVLSSLCTHIETSLPNTHNAFPLPSLAEALHSWCLLRGPESIRVFLPDLELT